MDLFSPELRRNPYPAYAHMREASPVFREPTRSLWLVFRYADVKRVLTDHQVFSSRAGSLESMKSAGPKQSTCRSRSRSRRAAWQLTRHEPGAGEAVLNSAAAVGGGPDGDAEDGQSHNEG